MKKCIFLAAFFLLSLSFSAVAQTSEANTENEAVKKAVEAYLYAKEPEIRRRAFTGRRNISLEGARQSRRNAGFKPISGKREKQPRNSQKIVAIAVTRDGAGQGRTEFTADATDGHAAETFHIFACESGRRVKIVNSSMPPLSFPPVNVRSDTTGGKKDLKFLLSAHSTLRRALFSFRRRQIESEKRERQRKPRFWKKRGF